MAAWQPSHLPPTIVAQAFYVLVRNKLDTWHPVAGGLLTKRERQCLTWAAWGKSFGESHKY